MVDSSNMPPIERARMGQPEPPDPVFVSLQRPALPLTDEVAFWELIYKTSDALSFDKFEQHIKEVCDGSMRAVAIRNLPFSRVEAYELLKTATDQFLIKECGILSPTSSGEWQDLADRAALQLGTPIDGTDLEKAWNSYVGENPRDEENIAGVIPYFDLLRNKFKDVKVQDRDDKHKQLCSIILSERLKRPCMIELIWSYWMEEAMLVQVLNAIALRFQNRRGPGDRKLFANLEIDPLRPLNNLLWGYIQDEQHRLSIARRAYEYDHHYGLRLIGKAVGELSPADSRSSFLGAFHRLLHLASRFYHQDDDTTVRADGFPVLNALKEVNLALGEGGSNQYGDLPWVARSEMLIQQWLLARPEMREFLSSRPSAVYPETWMERLESAKTLLGLSSPSVLHMYNLANMGERMLISIRLHPWTKENDTIRAANWARRFRSDVQGYIHAYNAATGVDLSAATVASQLDSRLPALLMRERRTAAGR
jgi:hypothetical protein